MATVAGIRSEEKRLEAQQRFEAGESPDMVKIAVRPQSQEEAEPLDKLEKERTRIQRTIRSLEQKLDEVEARIDSLGGAAKP